ncbi:hypothetical protein B0T26DRAFT_30702 [Lasiosphaeria miniovina]|uniref:Uncharacterized protein n=1 Tax=Lasiosphaeria miniovina TaxID=1954250 RepID=A0AA40E9S5_9PEZI|nr:uncharacterized protein B0T26DRAFT_30702 [Lasiosphaeria miniovina]KAK0733639.1 hypothetical protein B0T26DRAFT_30702 [Lasiosphaeria miniovina]
MVYIYIGGPINSVPLSRGPVFRDPGPLGQVPESRVLMARDPGTPLIGWNQTGCAPLPCISSGIRNTACLTEWPCKLVTTSFPSTTYCMALPKHDIHLAALACMFAGSAKQA